MATKKTTQHKYSVYIKQTPIAARYDSTCQWEDINTFDFPSHDEEDDDDFYVQFKYKNELSRVALIQDKSIFPDIAINRKLKKAWVLWSEQSVEYLETKEATQVIGIFSTKKEAKNCQRAFKKHIHYMNQDSQNMDEKFSYTTYNNIKIQINNIIFTDYHKIYHIDRINVQ